MASGMVEQVQVAGALGRVAGAVPRTLRTLSWRPASASVSAVAEEPEAQGDGLFVVPPGLGSGTDAMRWDSRASSARSGPLQHPGGVHRLLQQDLLDVVLGLELVRPGLEADLQTSEGPRRGRRRSWRSCRV